MAGRPKAQSEEQSEEQPQEQTEEQELAPAAQFFEDGRGIEADAAVDLYKKNGGLSSVLHFSKMHTCGYEHGSQTHMI